MRGAEALLQDRGPHPAGGAELGGLLEEVAVGGEEEGDAGREGVDVEPGVDRGFHVGKAVGEGEGDFLGGRGAGLADVVAGDGDRVPGRHVLGAPGESVGDEAH